MIRLNVIDVEMCYGDLVTNRIPVYLAVDAIHPYRKRTVGNLRYGVTKRTQHLHYATPQQSYALTNWRKAK